MEMLDIFFQIVLGLFMDPLLEIMEIKCIRVGYLLSRKPFLIAGEIIINLFSAEDAIDHVAAE